MLKIEGVEFKMEDLPILFEKKDEQNFTVYTFLDRNYIDSTLLRDLYNKMKIPEKEIIDLKELKGVITNVDHLEKYVEELK